MLFVTVDGLLEAKNVRSLLEFKYNEQLKNKLTQCGLLIQCLYYLKKFENAGDKLPSSIFVGDMNECFAIHTNSIVKYLSSEIDWKIAPSEAHKKNPELVKAMVGDDNILPFVYDIDNNFDIKNVILKIKELSSNVIRKVRITKHNIVAIFDYFDKNVLTGKIDLSTNEKANLFVQIVVNPNENYLHPKRKNVLITKSFGDLSVNQNLFLSFFSHFEGDLYSPKEKEGLTSLVDRLVEDSVRRNKGEFFTPSHFVDLAHKYISDVFGDDWKERFVVWDCAWGTGNLTRDYKFKELYVSTLEQSDIDTANQMGYNPEAVKFQYDFLNDGDDKLPQGLREAIENGKEILFLINPPYATARTDKNEGDSKTGVAKTKINDTMLKLNFGEATKNLYTQFIYKILEYNKNKNIKLALFSPNLFLTSNSFKNFNVYLKNNININGGFLMNAKYFDGTSMWPISFTLFSNENKTSNKFKMYEYDEKIFELVNVNEKQLEMMDGDRACDWVKLKNKNKVIAPNLSSTLNIKETDKKGIENMICVLNNGTNRVEKNEKECSFLSSQYSGNIGVPVNNENFYKATTLFTARKSIKQTWFNMKDEYYVPNENHSEYEQFTHDSIVYSIFNNRSYQSSLRQVKYKDKLWDIKNEFFWMSKDDMLKLAEEHHYDELYKDARTSDERFVYSLLFTVNIYDKLSSDAREVLDMASQLVIKSFEMRKLVSENHPEYHLDSWDAGWSQIKLVTKDYFKDEHKAFRDKYKELEDRMRPLVYELGFLRK
jgi:hypothetical protein